MNPKAQARMLGIYPGAEVPDWLRYSEKQRQMFAESAMIFARGNGATEDETAFREFGYDGSAEYWADRFSEPMKASEFITLLIRHIRRFGETGPGPARMYEQAFDLAHDMQETWFFDGPKNKALMIWPIEAAKWLLSHPNQKHLVPITLSKFLKGEVSEKPAVVVTTIKHKTNPPGRPKDLSNQVVAAMRAMIVEGAITRDGLSAKKQKELEVMFGVSRDTARKARDVVLSGNVENGVIDILPTNDK